MRETVAAYPALVRVSVQMALAYRGRLLLWFVGGLFPFLLMAVWLTVVDGGGAPPGWTSADFVGYYVVAAVVYTLTSSALIWIWDGDLRTGELSARMLRPVEPVHQYVAHQAGHALVSAALLLPVVAVAAVAAPGLGDDLTTTRAAGAVLAGALAFALATTMAAVFALIGFWTTQTANVWMLWWGLGSFASGWIAPLELMPEWLQAVGRILPFWYTMGFPVELALGRLDAGAAARAFAVGGAWLVVFALVHRPVWRAGVRRFQVVGG
jgi:ABC-2 type transport system permease protein